MDSPHVDEDRYHVVASASISGSGARVLKAGDSFAVLNRFGDIQLASGAQHGLFHRGTRFLSRLELRVGGERPLFLSSGMLDDNVVLAVELSNPELEQGGAAALPSGTVHISRSILLREGTALERLAVENHGADSVTLTLSYQFGADFVDLFEVRGTSRPRRGETLPAQASGRTVLLGYRGLDGLERRTQLSFEPTPSLLATSQADFELHLQSKQSIEISVVVECLAEGRAQPRFDRASSSDTAVQPRAFDVALSEASTHSQERREREAQLQSTSAAFNAWLERSRADLHMLATRTPCGLYPYAGVPWFSAPFGRDGIWTALQTLWLSPDYAAGVLRFLAQTQADRIDDANDAEPGKIVHEIREGEMAALGEIPFGRYYGSIDATPLYIVLADRYLRATADIALIQELWPHLQRAASWMLQDGDPDKDGFLEYGRRTERGLLQQGWKDSNDSVFHANGELACGPIALCEVQGYAYAAWSGLARLANAMNRPDLSRDCADRAEALRERFDRAFWCEELSTYALALDGEKRPCRVATSNAAHCLFSGIALPQRASLIAEQLMTPAMFSGWGVRTLSARERRYNPMSYHNGSIWPHDNAVAALGLASYGHAAEALRIFQGLFGVSTSVELGRLPELFCGFSRRPGQGPIAYPVACSPQAWAAGSIFMLLQAVLGMDLDAVERRITLRSPMLPDGIDQLWMTGLRVGSASLDLRLQRYPGDVGVTILNKQGDVQLMTVR